MSCLGLNVEQIIEFVSHWPLTFTSISSWNNWHFTYGYYLYFKNSLNKQCIRYTYFTLEICIFNQEWELLKEWITLGYPINSCVGKSLTHCPFFPPSSLVLFFCFVVVWPLVIIAELWRCNETPTECFRWPWDAWNEHVSKIINYSNLYKNNHFLFKEKIITVTRM